MLELQGRGSHLPQLPEELQGSDTLGAVSQATKGEQEAQEDKENASEIATIPLPNPRNSGCVLKAHVSELPASCLVDTGAVATIMSKLLWDKVEGTDQKNLLQTKCDLVGVPSQAAGIQRCQPGY